MANSSVLVIVNGLVQQQPVGDTLITANSLDLGNQSLVATEGDMLLGTSNNGTVLGDSTYYTTNSSNYFIASGGSATVNASKYGFLGGWGPTVTADCAAVGGGNSNDGLSGCSVTCGGHTSTANGPQAAIRGGLTNVASGNNSVVHGGESNNATGLCSAALGGKESFASGNYSSTIGNNCYMQSDFSQCWGGSYQSTSNTINLAVLAGGYEGAISGNRCTKLGGAGGTLNSSCGTMLGGYQYTGSHRQLNTTFAGKDHLLGTYDSVYLGGEGTDGSALTNGGYIAFVGKTCNHLDLYGGMYQSSGKIATAGDAQFISHVQFQSTSGNIASQMGYGSSSAPVIQPPNTLWVCEVFVAGIQNDGTRGQSYRLRGTIRRDGTANSVFCTAGATANPEQIVLAETTTSVNAVLSISTPATPRVLVTGIASTTFKWVAYWHIAQVGVF